MIRLGRPRKGEEILRREQLLEHAVRLFAERGYGNVSLETIAREARVSLRTIYRHFGGKAELFGAVARHYSDLFVATLPSGTDPTGSLEDALVQFGREYLRRITRPELLRLRVQFMAEAHRFPELAADFYAQGPGRTQARLARLFARQQEALRVTDFDPLFLAGQFINGLLGERYQRLLLGLEPPPDEGEIEDWARRAVAFFLGGACAARATRPGDAAIRGESAPSG